MSCSSSVSDPTAACLPACHSPTRSVFFIPRGQPPLRGIDCDRQECPARALVTPPGWGPTAPCTPQGCGYAHIPSDLVVDHWTSDGESSSHRDALCSMTF